MEKKQETKKTKSLTQKAKKIRSIIMMTLLCVLMMSAATYAWFTLSNTAKATNLTMTVGDTTGLQIAQDTGSGPGTFGSSIAFEKIDGKLLPATTTNGSTFQKPKYNDNGEVEGLEDVVTSETGREYFVGNTTQDMPKNTQDGVSENAKDGYYMQYTFWLKSLGADATVKLAPGNGISDGTFSGAGTYTGTYLLAKNVDNYKAVPASTAVRISFVPTADAKSRDTTVYEPNSNLPKSSISLVEGADFAKTASGTSIPAAVASTIKHNGDGTATETNGYVVQLTKDTPAKITLNVWIEGTDPQCVNQISAKNLIGQLVFTKEE